MFNSSLGIGFNKIVNLRINKLIIQETGTYNLQFLRPWQTTVDHQIQNAIVQAFGGENSKTIRPEAINPIANSFIQKQATPQNTIDLPNGWNEKRIRFLLEVQHEYQTGGSVKTYFLGYTDHVGVTVNGSIDSRMVFYVNSFVKTRVVNAFTATGNALTESVVDSKQVLHGSNDRSISNPNNTYGMRPQDLYRFFNSDLEMLQLGSNFDNARVFDTRITIGPGGKLADRRNNVPSYYGCNVFNNLLQVANNRELGDSQTEIVNSVVRGMECGADNLNNEPLFAALSSVRDNYRIGATFTFQELQKLDANVDNVTNYIVIDSHKRASLHSTGQTSDWHGSDNLTRCAATLAHSVPAIMMENMITRITFKSSNYEIGGRMNTMIISGNGFSNSDMRLNYENFRTSFEAMVLSQLTYNNSLSYALEMNVDLLGESWIRISIDNSPIIDYVTPSFADSLFSPLVSSKQDNVAEVANDFKILYETITEADPVIVNNSVSQFSTSI